VSTVPAVEHKPEMRMHRGVEIEWWYLFAFLAERYSLMACVWRYPGRHGAQGLMGTYALTSMDGSERRQATLVDATLLRAARDQLRAFRRENPDPLLDAVLEALPDGQVFAPYRLARRSSLSSSEARPLEAQVGPLALEQRDGGLRWTIDDDGIRAQLDVDLACPSFPMGGSGTFEIDGCVISGDTRPQCRIAGSVAIDGASERLEGRAWVDHQWGQWHLPRPTIRYHHPQWRYFALMLDDGRSVNLYLPDRPGENGREPVASRNLHAVLCHPDGSFRTAGPVRVAPLGSIESLRTHNVYEYGWRIEAPELRARFELEPLHPHHEVPVFLYQRGLLELPCRISGVLEGAPCRGRGFVECFGHTVDIHTFFWGQRKTHLARELERFMPRRHEAAWIERVCGAGEELAVDGPAIQKAIIDPIWSMMDRGGKGWRSVWLTTCCHALGHDRFDDRVRELLPVVEMLHTGSLVVDDVQDDSPLRRGLPSLHRQIGTDLAINVGNFLYFLPLVIVDEASWLTEPQRARVYRIILNAMRQGHLGQGLDLMTSRGRFDVAAKLADFPGTCRELIEQYRLKSGCQLEAIARIAGVLAEAPAERVEALARYSRHFGVAFQIVDDLIDMHEGREKLGKDHGEDLKNGRLNLLLFHALHAAPARERDTLARMLDGGVPADFDWVRDLVRRTGAAERCIVEARQLIETAWREMRCIPPSDATIIMRSVPLWLIEQRRRKAREIACAANGHANGRPPRSESPAVAEAAAAQNGGDPTTGR
jgi:geranylgeranyl pyrophosphate synthase